MTWTSIKETERHRRASGGILRVKGEGPQGSRRVHIVRPISSWYHYYQIADNKTIEEC